MLDRRWSPLAFCSDSSSKGFCLAETSASPVELRDVGRHCGRWRFLVRRRPLDLPWPQSEVIGAEFQPGARAVFGEKDFAEEDVRARAPLPPLRDFELQVDESVALPPLPGTLLSP